MLSANLGSEHGHPRPQKGDKAALCEADGERRLVRRWPLTSNEERLYISALTGFAHIQAD